MHFRNTKNRQEDQNDRIANMETLARPSSNFNSVRDESTDFLYQRRLDSKILSPKGRNVSEHNKKSNRGHTRSGKRQKRTNQ